YRTRNKSFDPSRLARYGFEPCCSLNPSSLGLRYPHRLLFQRSYPLFLPTVSNLIMAKRPRQKSLFDAHEAEATPNETPSADVVKEIVDASSHPRSTIVTEKVVVTNEVDLNGPTPGHESTKVVESLAVERDATVTKGEPSYVPPESLAGKKVYVVDAH